VGQITGDYYLGDQKIAEMYQVCIDAVQTSYYSRVTTTAQLPAAVMTDVATDATNVQCDPSICHGHGKCVAGTDVGRCMCDTGLCFCVIFNTVRCNTDTISSCARLVVAPVEMSLAGRCHTPCHCGSAVTRNASINIVTLRHAQLVPGLVTILDW